MNSETNQPEQGSSDIEELTAYLDGELAPEQIQKVETRLVDDQDYREEMQALQKTWDLLDAMPSTEPGTSFTKTTMELVVGEAIGSEKRRRSRSWVWPGRIAIMLAVPALLFASAFGVIRKMQTEPDRQLIENLSVVENYSRYDSVDCNLSFLRELSYQSLFSDSAEIADDDEAMLAMNESGENNLIPLEADKRRSYVTDLDVQKKLKLKRRFEDYLKKSEAEQQRLSEFDQQLTEDPNRLRLAATLTAYYDWLLNLDSGERSDLRDLAPDQRIRTIQKIRNRQVIEEFGKNPLAKLPTPEDAEYILGWCDNVFRLKEKQLRNRFLEYSIQLIKGDGARGQEAYLRRKAKNGNLYFIVDVLLRNDRQFVEDLILSNNEMVILYELLSTKAQVILEDRTFDERRELILNWVELAIQSQRGISMATLKRFEQGLSVQQRRQLEKMSYEDNIETLKRLYIEKRKSRRSSQDWWEQEWEDMFGVDDLDIDDP